MNLRETVKLNDLSSPSHPGQSNFISILEGVEESLSALVHTEEIQNRVARHGFDWPEVAPVFAKVEEELAELKEAFESGDQRHIEEELGDLLLVSVNLARHLSVDSETALKAASRKFTQRFHYIERMVAAEGRQLNDCTLAELDAFWDQAKVYLSRTGTG